MAVFLQTDRMTLRRFTAEDLDALVALDNDPDVMRYITAGAPVTRTEVAGYLWKILAAQHGEPGYGMYAAIDRRAGEFVGWFALDARLAGRPDQPELGYRLVRSAWGRGLGSEGSAAMIDRGFRALGADRVWAQTMAVNLASRRVLEKSGLRHVRSFPAEWPERIPGDEQGDVEYAITRAEWAARG